MGAYSQKSNSKDDLNIIDLQPFEDASGHWYGIADKGMVVHPVPNQPRYKTTDLKEVGDNILLYQKDNGGWPKNYDIRAILTQEWQKKWAPTNDVLQHL
jgi:hypothetical protein